MSNYMGGARSFAKRRHGGSASGTQKPRYPRLKAFSSRGFAMNRQLDGREQENVHQIELAHAKNASFPSKTREDGIQAAATGRIDAVNPMSIQSYPSTISKQRDASSMNLETLSGTDAETRRSKFSRILQHKNLLELAPLHPSERPVRTTRKQQQQNEMVTPERPHKKRRFNQSSATASLDQSHSKDDSLGFIQTPHRSSLHSQISKLDFFPSNDVTAKSIPSTMEDLLAELEEDDEILSFPPTPSKDPDNSQVYVDETEFDMYDSTYAFRDLSPETTEHMAESLFSMRDHSVISSRGSWGQASPSWTSDQQTFTPNDQELFSPRKVISSLMGYESDSSAVELEYSRLPNDRSGVGVPLERWICDNVEPERDNTLLEPGPSYELDDDDEASLIEHDWLNLPYENYTTVEPVVMASTSNSTSPTRSEMHSKPDVSSHSSYITEMRSPIQEEEAPIVWLKVNEESFVEHLSQDLDDLEQRSQATNVSDHDILVPRAQAQEDSQTREDENETFILAPDLFG